MFKSTDIFDPELFVRTAGFMKIPNGYDLSDCRLAILGIPFDCGTHPHRIGARHAPAAIRTQSRLLDVFYPSFSDANPLRELNLVDCGDACVVPGREESLDIIEAAVERIIATGTIPLTMGGDGAVTLPQLRALSKTYDNLTVLHFDAHTDTYPIKEHESLSTATTFTRATEENLINTNSSYHIGIRGPSSVLNIVEQTQEKGYQVISCDELFEIGIDGLLARLHESLAGKPVYLCWDMDFFDASCAPGVCDPTWGGPNAREGLEILEGLADLNFVGFDINTVSPPHDPQNMTAHLAATVMLICMHLACYTD